VLCVLVGVGDTLKIAIVALAGWGYELRIMKVVRWYCRGLSQSARPVWTLRLMSLSNIQCAAKTTSPRFLL